MNSIYNIILSAVSQGIIWSIMALGLYITFRLLNFADLTVDGSFATGGAVSAVLITMNVNPVTALITAFAAGMIAGFITGFLNTRMNISPLLSSILTQIGLYSINLHIMGKPNMPLLRVNTVFTNFETWCGIDMTYTSLILGAVSVLVIITAMYWFFGTEIGSAIRATGYNPSMVRALGVNTKTTIMAGLILGNGLVALSGGLLAQNQGFADIGMGTGAIVIGLATVIIGEVLFLKKNFFQRLLGVIFGSIVYRIVIAFVLKMKVDSNDLKLFTAIIVALALWIPTAIDTRRAAAARKNANKEIFEAERTGKKEAASDSNQAMPD